MKLRSKRSNGPVEFVSTTIAARMVGISAERLKQLEAGPLKGVLKPVRLVD